LKKHPKQKMIDKIYDDKLNYINTNNNILADKLSLSKLEEHLYKILNMLIDQ